jgi:hypothetical protein
VLRLEILFDKMTRDFHVALDERLVDGEFRKIPLHLLDSHSDGIKERKVLGILCQDRGERARDNVDNPDTRKISEAGNQVRAEKGRADWVCSGV